MVFQKPNPFPAMTIRDNVLAGLKLAGKRSRATSDALVEECLRARRPLERGQGPARRRRHVAVGRPAAAPVHRPVAGGAARRSC